MIRIIDDFKSFLIRNPSSNFFGQNLQDAWVLFNTKEKNFGYFVDIGASDGKELNNTYVLEKKYFWNGIVVEPNSSWHQKLKQNRSCDITFDCVWSESDKELDFIAATDAMLSTIKGFGENDEHAEKRKNNNMLKVKSISLLDLLKRHNAPKYIDYVSIDTEGSEFEILNAFFANNHGQFTIDYFTIEHNFVPEFRDKIYLLMTTFGYERVATDMSRWDDFYKRILS